MKSTVRLILLLLGTSLAPLGALGGDGLQQPPSATLALTPPMGWNSWNKFACKFSYGINPGMGDAMVKSGMKDAGYQYVVIDGCWQVSRGAEGNIVADPQRFPAGITAPAC